MSKRSVIALLVACASPAHAFVPAGRRSLPRTAAAGVERHELALTAVRRSVQPQMAAAAVATRLGAGGLLATLTRPVVAVAATLLVVIAWAFKRLNTPSRVYDREANSVGREYDAWTSEGVLEYYWGEHIHLGWYAEGEPRVHCTAARTSSRPSTTSSTRCSSFRRQTSQPPSLTWAAGSAGRVGIWRRNTPRRRARGSPFLPSSSAAPPSSRASVASPMPSSSSSTRSP